MRLTKAWKEVLVDELMAYWEAENPAPKGEIDNLAVSALKQWKKGEDYKQHKLFVGMNLGETERGFVSASYELMVFSEGHRFVANIPLYLPLMEAAGIESVLPPKAITCGNRLKRGGFPDTYAAFVASQGVEAGDEVENYQGYLMVSRNNQLAVVLERDDPALIAWNKAMDARTAWNKEEREVRRETERALGQFRTAKQLQEGWPEAAAIAEKAGMFKGKVPGTALVVPVEQLNDKLGIKR